MKTYLLLIIMITGTQLLGQIPNNSFENWVQDSTWENPLHWESNNRSEQFISVTKVPSFVDNNYAMKVISNGVSFEGNAMGLASCSFLPKDNYNRFNMLFRIDSIDPGGQIEILISQWNGSDYQLLQEWKTQNISQEIDSLSLGFNKINMDSLRIEIISNTELTELGYEGYSEIMVDQLSLSLFSSTNTPGTIDAFKIYPNPVSDVLQLDIGNIQQFEGQFVLRNALEMVQKEMDIYSGQRRYQLPVYDLQPGMYFFEISSEGQSVKSGLVVVE